ncbi:transposable element Tcb2 transposase [Trichonephila clavipes]|nr:transposable element Tcb2 transposase [Trichonephila clavipes]
MGLQFLFMDDNAPCHRTVAAEQLLESRRLAARTLPPVTIRELRLALQDEWAAMPQQLIDTLILSMGRRCETCLSVRGDHIPLLKTGCFLLDTHHRDVSDFSRIALHATFSIKLLFIPLISLLRCALTVSPGASRVHNIHYHAGSTRHKTWSSCRSDLVMMLRNRLRQDFIRVVENLDGTVESTDTIVKLKTKIENSSTFESDPDFVKTLIQNCIDDRVLRNEREVALGKQKIELAELQLAKLEKEIELQRAKNKALSLNPAAKVEEKQFETLNKETATHIGIREAEDWFRSIDLAKECDIYISSRSGSHKEIPITYGYTQDPFKNRSQNFKPKIKENYPQYLERENKNCYICGDSSHCARDCEKRFKPKESNSHIHNRINVNTLKIESEKQNSDECANLQYVNIFVENQPVTALIDSGCQIPVLNSSIIIVQTPSEEIITLSSCFGEKRMVEVKPINLSLNQHSPGAHAYAYPNVVSVSNVIENSSYDLTHVKNFNTRNDLSSLIKDYKFLVCSVFFVCFRFSSGLHRSTAADSVQSGWPDIVTNSYRQLHAVFARRRS